MPRVSKKRFRFRERVTSNEKQWIQLLLHVYYFSGTLTKEVVEFNIIKRKKHFKNARKL